MLGRTALAIAICSTLAYAQRVPIPTADMKGGQDSPLLKRYDGSFIVAYDRKSFDEFTLPLSPLEPLMSEKRTKQNNRVFEPKKKKVLAGSRTRIVYLVPVQRSSLEIPATIRMKSRARAARCCSNARERSAAALQIAPHREGVGTSVWRCTCTRPNV